MLVAVLASEVLIYDTSVVLSASMYLYTSISISYQLQLNVSGYYPSTKDIYISKHFYVASVSIASTFNSVVRLCFLV